MLQQNSTAKKLLGSVLKTYLQGLGEIETATYDEATHSITLTFTNGSTLTTGNLQGATGPQGPSGANGANGSDGISPTVTIEEITTGTGGVRITIIDAEHPDGQTFEIMNGADGTGSISTVNGISPVSGNVPLYSSVQITLSASGWSSKSQTVSVSGLGASDIVQVSPSQYAIDSYVNAGIKCVSQMNGSLKFECTEVPTRNVLVNILIMKVAS